MSFHQDKRTSRRLLPAAAGLSIAGLSAAFILPVAGVPAASAANQSGGNTMAHRSVDRTVNSQSGAPGLSAADLAGSAAAANSPAAKDLIERNIESQSHAAPEQPQSGPRPLSAKDAQEALSASPKVAGTAVPVYALSPEFVSGKSGTPGTLQYVAYSANQGAAAVTVFTSNHTPDGTWQPVNVASGQTESTMAAKAGGAQLLHEPQINAWYAVSGGTVRALNAGAVSAIGSTAVSVSSYQARVAKAYGDKLPGSKYDADGLAGGFGPITPAPALATTKTTAGSALSAPAVIGVASLALVATGGLSWVIVRRRRAS